MESLRIGSIFYQNLIKPVFICRGVSGILRRAERSAKVSTYSFAQALVFSSQYFNLARLVVEFDRFDGD